MPEVHDLVPRRVGHLQQVSTVLPDLLSSKGYKPIAPSPEKEATATAAAMILVGNYRRDEAASPEVRIASLAAILAEYPDDCIRYVTDPRTGIQSFKYSAWRQGKEVQGPFKSFPPEPGELQEACERYMAPIRRREDMERRAREEAEQRRAEEERSKAAEPGLIKAIEAYRNAPARRTGLVDDLAARIMRNIESGTSARRVEEDLARRRAARAV